jgi:hypothetical protein
MVRRLVLGLGLGIAAAFAVGCTGSSATTTAKPPEDKTKEMGKIMQEKAAGAAKGVHATGK